MGKVAAKIKVMPNSPELDLDDLEDALEDSPPGGAKIKSFERGDVAFELIAPLPTVIAPDDAGGTETTKETLIKAEGVENVSIKNIGRI